MYANNYSKQLLLFDKTFTSASQSKKNELHNGLKHIYVDSIMKDDYKLKYEALKRLISSSKVLKYDYTGYEKEAKTLEKIYDNLKKPASKPAVKKKTTTQTIKKPTQQTTSILKLIDFEQDNDKFIFKFNKDISNKIVKSFVMSDKNIYRHVYDINSVVLFSKNDEKIYGLEQFRVSQFDKNTTRVVFSANKKLTASIKFQQNKLVITIKELEKKDKIIPKPNKTLASSTNNTTVMVNLQIQNTNKIVVIDPGHGGVDGGAIGTKSLLEKNIVLDISLQLGAELEKRGYKVFYTRKKDLYIKLRDRTKVANDKNADIFISIHANAAPSGSQNEKLEGVETYFLSPARSEKSINVAALENQSDIEEMDFYSKATFLNFLNREKIIASHKLAIDIQQYALGAVSKKFEVVDGGVREAPFWVLVGAQMPAILFEVGYITNTNERAKIFNKEYQKLLVDGMANGIEAYFTKTDTFYE